MGRDWAIAPPWRGEYRLSNGWCGEVQAEPAGATGNRAASERGIPEVSLNQKVKNLIQKLGEAIHESVSESEHIAGVVRNIREQGFDVLLMLEATIGLNEVEDESPETLALTDGSEQPAGEGPFTNSDLSFLKSLRISLPEGMSTENPAQPEGLSNENPGQ